MADRSRRHGVRRVSRLLVLTVAVFVLGRVLGPSVAVVRDGSLAPILESGDIVWVRPVRGEVDRGSVVLVVPYLSRPSGFLPDSIGFGFDGSRETDEPDDPDERDPNRSDTPDDPSPPAAPPRSDALVPRIVVGRSGDDMTWTDSSVVSLASDGTRFRLSPEILHPLLRPVERSVTVPEESMFTVSLSGGMIDSRLIGPRPDGEVRYQVRRIMWPRERRGVLLPVESDRSAPR